MTDFQVSMDEFFTSIPTLDQDLKEVLFERRIALFLFFSIFILAFYTHHIVNYFCRTNFTFKHTLFIWSNVGLIAGLLIFLFGIETLDNFTVYRETINDPRFPKNHSLKIAAFADLHLHYPIPHMLIHNTKKILEVLHQENPDFVLVAGDIVSYCGNSTYQLQPFLSKFFKQIEQPVYFIAGNHDMACYETFISIMKNSTFHAFNGEVIQLTKYQGKNNVFLSGLSYPTWEKKEFRKTLRKLKKKHKNGYNILLHHYYNPLLELAELKLYDLIIVGHSHGGQIVMPHSFWAMHPDLNYEYTISLKYHTTRIDQSVIHTMWGSGLSFYPKPQVRIGVKPEISMLTIQNY